MRTPGNMPGARGKIGADVSFADDAPESIPASLRIQATPESEAKSLTSGEAMPAASGLADELFGLSEVEQILDVMIDHHDPQIVAEAITQHIDKRVLTTTKVAERSEREILKAWAEQLEARP